MYEAEKEKRLPPIGISPGDPELRKDPTNEEIEIFRIRRLVKILSAFLKLHSMLASIGMCIGACIGV